MEKVSLALLISAASLLCQPCSGAPQEERSGDWCAILFENGAYNQVVPGMAVTVFHGTTILNDMDDKTSSAIIQNGCILKLYKDKDSTELIDTLKKSKNFKNSGAGNYNDEVSSVDCLCTATD